MRQDRIRILAAILILGAAVAVPALAQVELAAPSNTIPEGQIVAEPPAEIDPAAIWQTSRFCTLFGPAEVQGFRVQCTNATFLDFAIADGFIPGDHWSLKGKNWDSAPNTSVTTSPGPVPIFGLRSRVYNYGGTPTNPRNLDAYLQCTYLHGVDVFPASSFVSLSSDGTCTVTADPIRSRIDRMP
ncbi:MAG: hypothetical protein D6696_06810 [Acidobacteria bacterium]|nr:MAG: hypothetical protein D6696_06810 [Acidobacteriota bacterium]